MSDSKSSSGESAGEDGQERPVKSFGNISEHHWSRARKGTNQEAIDYYRKRSHDPGVEEGGESRNFYCMECGGVIPFEEEGAEKAESCPHCSASLSEDARRYFNWVEIDRPVQSELRSIWPLVVIVILGIVGLGYLLVRFVA